MIVVKTTNGYVTSYREAWKDEGRSVWTWRTDKGEPPHDFGSREAAEKWVDEVWVGSTPKERADAAWVVEVLS